MKVLIVDDEQLARQRLATLLGEIANITVVGEAANGHEAIKYVVETEPDLVLLDIRMPGMDGLEAATHMNKIEKPPAVIFTTAYSDYAIEAFKARAVDYLLKPVRRERLSEALKNAQRLSRAQLMALQDSLPQNKRRTHISARVKGGIQLVSVDDILYLQADQKYVTVRFKDGEVLIDESLKSLEDEFTERFLRIHRNALVASAYLDKLEKDKRGHCLVSLKGCETKLEISRRHLPTVRKYMLKG